MGLSEPRPRVSAGSVGSPASRSGIRQKADKFGLAMNACLVEYALKVDPHRAGHNCETRSSRIAPITLGNLESNRSLGRRQSECFAQSIHACLPFALGIAGNENGHGA